jgi:hypothetical protein
MPIIRSAALVLFACSRMLAQSGADATASIEGSMLNALTGEPIPRAHVMLYGWVNGAMKRFGAITTAEGKFSMIGLPAGEFQMLAERVGFQPLESVDTSGQIRWIQLAPGDSKTDLEVKMIPSGAITGQVVDADGEPAENVSVKASGGRGSQATTDNRGHFRLDGLAAGRYLIWAEPPSAHRPPEIRTDGTAEAHYSRTFYPASLDARGGARVRVAAGAETTGIEIRLVRTPFVTIKGRVVGMPPRAGQRFVHLRVKTDSLPGSSIKADGSFTIWGPDPGKYELVGVWTTPAGSYQQTVPQDVVVSGSNIEGIVLHYEPPLDIAGVVEFDDDSAKPSQKGNQPPLQVALSAEGSFLSPPPPADIAGDGSFVFHQAPHLRYRVSFNWPPLYIKALRLGGTEMRGDILDLTHAGTGGVLTVVVSSAVGRISGTVTDSQEAVSGASVALVPDDAARECRFSRSLPNGTYTMEAVPPGPYRIAALTPDQSGEMECAVGFPEDVRNIESIEVRPGEKITRDLKQ